MTDTTKNENEIKEGHLPIDFHKLAKTNAGKLFKLFGDNAKNEEENKIFKSLFGLSYKEGDTKAYFSGYVSSYLYSELVRWSDKLDKKATGTLYINSFGGDAYAGIAICNLLKEKGNINTCIDGIAYSAASIIVQGGAKRISKTGANIGIHQASSFMYGKADEMEKEAKQLRIVNKSIMEVYKSRATDTEQVMEWFNEDTLINNEDALETGLIDEIYEPKKDEKKEDKKVENSKEPVKEAPRSTYY